MKDVQEKKGITPLKNYYSESFKIKVVREVEGGLLSKEAAKRKYGIRGKSAVLSWCRQYGQSRYPIMLRNQEKKPVTPDDKDQRIAELEAKLTYSKIKIDALESLIEVANEIYGIDLKKKVGIKRRKR
jgi:transposase